MDAIDFVARCDNGKNVEPLVSEFQEHLHALGFSCSAAGGWIGVGANRTHRFYFNTWPEDWLVLYNKQEIFKIDPIVAHARRSLKPFRWTELRKAIDDPHTARVAQIADAYGWREVLGVPIHGPYGYQGLVSMASMDDVSLTGTDIATIEVMSVALHRRCNKTLSYGLGPTEPVKLTDRQLVCLGWVAAGRSDTEIAEILGVSPTTARFHIEEAKRRIGVSTRIEAVAMLVLAGRL